MQNNMQNVNSMFDVIISLLRNSPMTIVKEAESKGNVIRIYKATHTQASIGNKTSLIFKGTPKEVIRYLQGIRDTLTDLLPDNDLNTFTEKLNARETLRLANNITQVN